MRLKGIYLLTVATVFLLTGICFSDTDEDFDKVGFIGNDGANVRAGDNKNFESLCQLEEGAPIKVVGKRYSWFKIELPKEAHLYIKNDYVELVPKGDQGLVSAVDVNLRAGPGTKYSILGQVSNPAKVIVISEVDDWYEIEPPHGTTGWIHSSEINFDLEEDANSGSIKSKTVESAQKKGNPSGTTTDSNIKQPSRIPLTSEPLKQQGNLTISTPRER